MYGFDNLRVIGASIMPRDCNADTALTTIVGERMAARLHGALLAGSSGRNPAP